MKINENKKHINIIMNVNMNVITNQCVKINTILYTKSNINYDVNINTNQKMNI